VRAPAAPVMSGFGTYENRKLVGDMSDLRRNIGPALLNTADDNVQ